MVTYTGRETFGRLLEAETTLYTTKISYTASSQIEYVGEAEPNTATGTAGWRIKKMTYDANGLQTDVQWASGNRLFDKTWTGRAGYAYS